MGNTATVAKMTEGSADIALIGKSLNHCLQYNCIPYTLQCFGSGWIRVFSPIRIRPFFALTNQWDLNDVLWLDFGGTWPKRVECWDLKVQNMILKNFKIVLTDPDPDFSGSYPDFCPIRIRTQEKKVRSGSGQKDPDPKHWYTVLYRVCNYINTGTSWRHKACINIYIYRLPVPRFDENVDFLNLILSLEYKSAKSDSEN